MLLLLPFDAKCYFSIFLLCECVVAHASHGENIHYVSCLAKHTFSDQWLTITGQRVRVCECAKYVASLELLLLSSIFFRFAFAVSAKVVFKTRSNGERVSLMPNDLFVGRRICRWRRYDKHTIHKFHGIYTSLSVSSIRTWFLNFVCVCVFSSCYKCVYSHEKCQFLCKNPFFRLGSSFFFTTPAVSSRYQAIRSFNPVSEFQVARELHIFNANKNAYENQFEFQVYAQFWSPTFSETIRWFKVVFFSLFFFAMDFLFFFFLICMPISIPAKREAELTCLLEIVCFFFLPLQRDEKNLNQEVNDWKSVAMA